MSVTEGNLFSPMPQVAADESIDEVLARPGVRIERIVSYGHVSPPDFWFDQDEDEWVCLVDGEALLAFADGPDRRLFRGDWLLVAAGCRHRILATSSPAVWLAVFVAAQGPAAHG